MVEMKTKVRISGWWVDIIALGIRVCTTSVLDVQFELQRYEFAESLIWFPRNSLWPLQLVMWMWKFLKIAWWLAWTYCNIIELQSVSRIAVWISIVHLYAITYIAISQWIILTKVNRVHLWNTIVWMQTILQWTNTPAKWWDLMKDMPFCTLFFLTSPIM